MDRYNIKHRSGWLACNTWSVDRAKSWLADFDPKFYTDKSLKREDFHVIDRQTGKEIEA